MCLKEGISDGEILRRGFSSGFEGIFCQDDDHFFTWPSADLCVSILVNDKAHSPFSIVM